MRPKKEIIVNKVEYEDLDIFLAVGFPLPADSSKFFKYHPPKTEERKKLHERVGDVSQRAYDLFTTNCENWDDYYYYCGRWEIIESLIDFAIDVCKEPTCLQWAIKSILDISSDKTSILMVIQQFRMFLNQGITIEEPNGHSGD